MAIGTTPRGPGLIAYTIYVHPSQELAGQSWQWPQSWHDEFVHARWNLGLAAAWCIARGGTFDENPPVQQTILGMSFVVERKGNSFYITILQFEGPEHDPSGPNGGARQPAPVSQLVLGLRGANRYHHLVVFQGVVPPTPGPHSQSKVIFVLKVPYGNPCAANADALPISIRQFETRRYLHGVETPIHRISSESNCAPPPSIEGVCGLGAEIESRTQRKGRNQLTRKPLEKPSCVCFEIEYPKPILQWSLAQKRPRLSAKMAQQPRSILLQDRHASSRVSMRLDRNNDRSSITWCAAACNFDPCLGVIGAQF
jgi:hypothetical protein